MRINSDWIHKVFTSDQRSTKPISSFTSPANLLRLLAGRGVGSKLKICCPQQLGSDVGMIQAGANQTLNFSTSWAGEAACRRCPRFSMDSASSLWWSSIRSLPQSWSPKPVLVLGIPVYHHQEPLFCNQRFEHRPSTCQQNPQLLHDYSWALYGTCVTDHNITARKVRSKVGFEIVAAGEHQLSRMK